MDGCQSHDPTARRCLSLIIPAYNEEAGIRLAVQEADRALAELADEYEILVIDDGSSDRTAEVVEEIACALPPVRLVRHSQNHGYGAALRTGFQAARFDCIAFTDADCQFYLADLAALVSLIREAPIAVGYRVGRQDPWPRRFFSWGYNLLVRTLLGTRVRDCDCALKVFRREALPELLPQTDGFFVNTEMLARARQLGYEIAEAPVRHRPRFAGESKVSLWDIPRTLRTLLPFWWSRILFPADCEAPSAKRGAQSAEVAGICSAVRASHSAPGAPRLLLLLVAAALLFFSRLDCPLQEPEEPRYAEIPREMLHSDNLVLPILHGRPYYDKPPLLYWLVMGSYQAFGIHDWAARLVPCTAAFLTVLVTYLWGSRMASRRAGFAAAMILALSARFVYLGRLLTMNSLLCLWVVTAWAAAHVALRGPTLRWRWWLFSAGACGLGLLTKGPVALALVGIPMLLYRLLDARTSPLKLRSWIAYLGTALLLAAPWFLLVAGNDPGFIRYFFWKHNIVRYLAPFDHQKPIYAYLPELLLGMFPWSLILLPLLRSFSRHGTAASPSRPAAMGFFLITFLWCLGFYSVAGSKRSGYILPAMPPLVLALGCYLDHRFGCRRKPAEAWGICAAATFAVLFLSLCLLGPRYAEKFSLRAEVQPYAELCKDLEVPVVCYPRCWDSVSFYLGRDDVRVYTREQRRELIADLCANPRTFAFVKCDHSLDELLRELPISLEFVPCGRQANVAVGWVRPRQDAPGALFAGR